MAEPSEFADAMSGPLREEMARRMVTSTPQTQALGFQFLSMSQGRGSIRAPWRAELVGDPEDPVATAQAAFALIGGGA